MLLLLLFIQSHLLTRMEVWAFCYLIFLIFENYNAGTQFSKSHLKIITYATILGKWDHSLQLTSLESWALSLPSASIRGKSPPIPCWSHVDPHRPPPLHISPRTPWCSLLQLETPTIPTTLCNLSPRTEKGSESAGAGRTARTISITSWVKGTFVDFSEFLSSTGSTVSLRQCILICKHILETCIVFKFNLLNLLHKLDTKNSYTDNV